MQSKLKGVMGPKNIEQNDNSIIPWNNNHGQFIKDING